MASKSFQSLLEAAKQRDAYWVAKAIQDFTEDLSRLMEDQGMSKAELARRIGKTPAYVTKILRGNTNFTIDSMVRIARAVGGELSIHVAPTKMKASRTVRAERMARFGGDSQSLSAATARRRGAR